MSEHLATMSWERRGGAFVDNRYSRAHEWSFDGGLTVPASASPHVVRPPGGNPPCKVRVLIDIMLERFGDKACPVPGSGA